ncbi:MAG: polysaccharide biosynthesis/export family protein [Bacteroidales bacterium]|nr:polysaccharide biosynthesis/export family protein [Bacteroidales bacterium]
MKKSIRLVLCMLALIVSACVTPSRVTYIKDMAEGYSYPAKPAPDLRVRIEDRLGIRVFSDDESLAKPFNIGALTQTGGGVQAASYEVDGAGNIDFPVLGLIPVEGLTLKEVQEKISGMISNAGYIKDPVVTVGIDNFTVTLVKYGTTTQVPVHGKSINLLQVVAPAQGEKIKEVEVIRTENGVRKAYHVNFQKTELFDSPVFYLQQNDIVYVKPARWMVSDTGRAIQQAVSMVMTFTSTIVSTMALVKLYQR